MRFDSSQGRLKTLRRTLRIGGILAIPALVSLGLGVGLGIGFLNPEDPQQKAEQVKIQAQMGADQVASEIELLRLEGNQENTQDSMMGEASDRILLKADLLREADGKVKIKSKAQSPSWVPGRYFNADTLIQSVTQSVFTKSAEQANPSDVSVVSLRADRSGGAEWLCFIFKKEPTGQTFSLVLVDPARYFKAFSNWHLHGGNGKYRSFLIGTSGVVLAHSQASLAATDLSTVPIFTDLLKKVVGGTQRTASGRLTSLDHQWVELATLRVGSLPLAVVVESPNPEASPSAVRKAALFLGFFFLWGVLWYCASFLRRHLVEVRVQTVMTAPSSDDLAPQRSAEFFTQMDFLILGDPASKPLTSHSATVKPSNEES